MKETNDLNARKIALLGLLIALQIVFTQVISINLPGIRIGFSFLPIAITGLLFGPVLGGVASLSADVLGKFMLPGASAFHAGFAFSSFLQGAIFGLFFYKKDLTWGRIIITVLVESLLTTGLNSIWLTQMFGLQSMLAGLPARLINLCIMIPVKVAIFTVLFSNKEIKRLITRVEK